MNNAAQFATVTAGFGLPLEILTACHESMRAQLDALNRLAAGLPVQGADPAAQRIAVHLLHYFNTAVFNHQADEEEDLCPLLLRRVSAGRGVELQTLVDWMRRDHRRLLLLWQELRVPLQTISQGGAAELSRQRVQEFVQAYRLHIDREESELLPLVKGMLTGRDKAELTKTMTARRSRQP